MVMAEVTQPSLSVCYQPGRAMALSKAALCLFCPQSGRGLPAMIGEQQTALGSGDYEAAKVGWIGILRWSQWLFPLTQPLS